MNLTALQHSPFLQSLGWAIANSLWQAAALWIAYLLVNGIYKGASARFKNNLSTILLSSAFVWFCITLFSKYLVMQNLLAEPTGQVYQLENVANITSWNTVLNKVVSVLPYLSVAYLFLLLFFSIRMINIYRYTRFIKFNGLQKPGVEWKLFTEKVARHMGITKKIRIWVSHHIDVPATIGFIKPVILIPLASINQLSADQLEAIILHELSHIKRNDYLINLFVSIVETILFFNPFVVLLARVIKRERENCCDDFVIQYQYDRHAYASALLSLEQFRNMNLRLAIGATSGKKQLLLRVKRIMEINNSTNFNYGQKLVALLLITGIICSVAWLSPESKQNKTQQAGTGNKNILPKKITAAHSAEPLPGVLFLSPNNNLAKEQVKVIAIKSTPKKTPPKTDNFLKEVKVLSLQEIALREYKMANRLSQESRKQIARKNMQKNNLDKFLMAKGSYGTLFENAKTMAPFNAYTYVDASQQKLFSIDMKKLQGELDKVQFFIDYEQLYNKALQAFTPEKLKSLIQQQLNIRDVPAGFERILKSKLKKVADKEVRRVKGERLQITTHFNDGSFYFVIDTLIATEVNLVGKRTRPVTAITKTSEHGESRNIVVNKNTVPATQAYVYTNGKSVSTYATGIKIYSGKSTTVESNEKPTPVKQSKPGVIYHRFFNADTPPGKIFLPKEQAPQTPNNKSLRVEYKNGIIVINGKKVKMPDTHELFALHSVKVKKLLSRVKDLVETQIDE
jgi:beta-lactamase regulating signal transducer with metallopeptidase domain